MSDENEGKMPKRSASASLEAEAIEELYRLAEILMDSSDPDIGGTLSRRSVAKLRMKELLDSLGTNDAREAEMYRDNKWVLDVLQDLAVYAEGRDLAELHRILVDARFLALRALKKG